eukprot:CCRYP_009729-RA/>CCRYP_009729-RA protein AED:0.21 eAED:0.21 QI:131/1/1/1/0.87/0.77/9/1400/1710
MDQGHSSIPMTESTLCNVGDSANNAAALVGSPCKRAKIAVDMSLSSAEASREELPDHSVDSDDDIEVLSPSRFKEVPATCIAGEADQCGITSGPATAENGEDDDVIMTSTNMTNPNIHYPHMRCNCGVHAFSPDAKNNENHCPKCYCFICDTLAAECDYWDELKLKDAKSRGVGDCDYLTNLGPHCNAYYDKASTGAWESLKVLARNKNNPTNNAIDEHGDVTVLSPPAAQNAHNPYNNSRNDYAGIHSAQIREEILSRLANIPDAGLGGGAAMMMERVRTRKEMRIPEVLLENFRNAVTLHENNISTPDCADSKIVNRRKTEGDIPNLALTSTFIEGIKIGFPFPKIMKPQRQIMLHLIRALKNKKHVVLESPTGTGKSAAILCSVLAWQRAHARAVTNADGGEGAEGGKVRIIYCSRTHSQVTQMVASLKSTPYRPRMAILGSREKLCIHKSIRPRTPNAETVTGINVNNECRVRVRNTEKYRKHRLTNPAYDDPYLDEDPPDDMPGDGSSNALDDGPQQGEAEESQFIARSKTCPHYRQLTANRIANLAHSTFVPNNKVDCCTIGGKKSKYGAHDIEDLVDFGKDPYLQSGIALYRGKESESYGLKLKGRKKGSQNFSQHGGCFVESTKKGTPADMSGSLQPGDKILRVNGCDVSQEDAAGVALKIREASGDSLMLDVTRGGSGTLSRFDGEYSSHAACPYYISQMLSKDSDLVFAPYNYVLDPQIRKAMGIELTNAVVVLDEGHNIEGTLRDAGSGKFGEFELCDLIVMLNNYAITEKNTYNMLDVEGEGESMFMCDIAHALLLFVEKIASTLKRSRQSFENNTGRNGAQAALREYEKFHLADDSEFEIAFYGPTGHGGKGVPVGCLPFFQELGLLQSDFETLESYMDAFEKFFRGSKESNESSGERDRISNLVDRLIDLVHKMCAARKTSEHYYAAIVACANGNLAFANGEDVEGNDEGGRRRRKKPRALPLIPPRTAQNSNRSPNPCLHAHCKAACANNVLDPIRHGQSCDGSTPKWEAVLNLQLLTPGPLFQELADECRTVVLASGSLAPISSLCAELNLFSSDSPVALPPITSGTSSTTAAGQKRLQTQPPPLEADHVVNLERQLFVVSIGQFPDGAELHVAQKNYSKMVFLEKLGDAIVRVIEGIPEGGVLVFLPSYNLLGKCERLWNPAGNTRYNRRAFWSQEESTEPSVWDRLRALKHNVIVEPSGGAQAEFEEKKREYMESVENHGGCVLLAVYRGKMSEGISFNDNYARGVICVGVPLPSPYHLPVKVKMNYNEEQRKLRNRTDLLPGQEWYKQQADRAIAQALGRCIRHSADYGAIFLMDTRHCDRGIPNDGIPNAHKNLPKWMRMTVRNLSMNSTSRNSMFNYGSPKTVCGGYAGLKKELHKFFRDAKPFVSSQTKNELAVGATNATANVQQLTPPSSSRLPPNLATGSNSGMLMSVQHMQLSAGSKSSTLSTDSDDVVIVDRPPSRNFEGAKAISKRNTLMSAFQKQKENEPAVKPSKAAKRSSTPTNLKAMFEKQLSASVSTREMTSKQRDSGPDSHSQANSRSQQNLHPNTHNIVADTQLPPRSSPQETTLTQEMSATNSQLQEALNPTMQSFKRSPFAKYMYSPQQGGTSPSAFHEQAALAGISSTSNGHDVAQDITSDEHLCVICEDAKKQVVILPCRHMCLCQGCADFDKIKECPMCRTKVEGSMVVFI